MSLQVYVFQVADLTSKTISAYEASMPKVATASSDKKAAPPKMLRLFALYENLTRFVLPLCSAIPRPHPETPVSQSNNIVDISNVGLKQFWNLKGHMQDASVLATAHYPETLDRIFVSFGFDSSFGLNFILPRDVLRLLSFCYLSFPRYNISSSHSYHHPYF